MGLTSSVPNSILQPGVCTSTTRPAAPYEGQVVYETDTNKTLFYNGTAWVILNDPNAVSIDASGNVTFSNDATVSGDLTVTGNMTSANQGLTFIKSQTIGSGVSSVTVTNVFSSNFENYKVLTNIENASANNDVYFRLGGVSTNTYDRTRQLWFVASSTPGYGAETAQTAGWWGVNRTGEGSDTVSEIFRPYIAKPTTVKSEAFYKDIAGQMQFRLHASIQRGDLSHTSLTLLVSSGTMSGGTIRVYGYNNG